MNEVEVLIAGVFDDSQVLAQYDPSRFNAAFDALATSRIKSRWEEQLQMASEYGRTLFSSNLFRLDSAEKRDDELRINLGDTDYRDYVGTRRPDDIGIRANPVGTLVIAITNDGYMPMGWRALSLDVNPGRLFTFGGFFDRALDIAADGEPDIFACARREMNEELPSAPIESLKCLGILYDNQHAHPEIVMLASLGISRNALVALPTWSDEVESTILVHRDEAHDFVKKPGSLACPTLIAAFEALLVYG